MTKEMNRRQFLKDTATTATKVILTGGTLSMLESCSPSSPETKDTRLVTHAQWIKDKDGKVFNLIDGILKLGVTVTLNPENIRHITKLDLTASPYGRKEPYNRPSQPDSTLDPKGGYPIWALAEVHVNDKGKLVLSKENPKVSLEDSPDNYDIVNIYFTIDLNDPTGTSLKQPPLLPGDSTELEIDFHGNGQMKDQLNVANPDKYTRESAEGIQQILKIVYP